MIFVGLFLSSHLLVSLLNVSTDDVQTLFTGERAKVTAGPVLRRTRWVGGLFVQYATPVDQVNDFLVEQSFGQSSCGFFLSPSENYNDPRGGAGVRNWTSMQPANPEATTLASGASTQTINVGGGRFLFRHFERIALDAGGARVAGPAVYNLMDPLKISENGLLCNDPDAFLMLATGGFALRVGICCALPEYSQGRLGIDYRDY